MLHACWWPEPRRTRRKRPGSCSTTASPTMDAAAPACRERAPRWTSRPHDDEVPERDRGDEAHPRLAEAPPREHEPRPRGYAAPRMRAFACVAGVVLAITILVL